MVPWLVLAGIILVPSAAFLLWSWRAQRNDMALMRTTETTRAADVAKLPPGSLVEVKGRLRCAAPVTGELSNSPCAHFAATVERDYEIVEYDSRRKTSYRVRKTEIVQSNTLFAPFEIEDDSGRAKVLPEHAIIEGIEAVGRSTAPEDEAGGTSVMQAALGASNSPDRTLGFRYKEMHLPLDVEVYVLGVVGDNCCIGAPPDGAKGQRFLISVKSEETRAAELGSASTWMLGLGAICLLGAAISLGSALWLTRERLSEVAPPQDLLQGDRFW
jgi:E3 ubiquitin ligase